MNCTNCQAELPSGARFCMNCGKAVGDASEASEARRERLAAAAPSTLMEKARAASRLTGERRIVTAMFVDVVGSRAMVQKLGQAAADEIIYGGLDLACPIIYRYEGTIAQLQEDELLVFFGAPVAHEDDPVRAVRAGLDLLDEVRKYSQTVQAEHGFPFEIRISLSTGPVTIGPIQEDLRYSYSALGGSLTMVALVESFKQAMAVLVSGHTYRFIAPFFDCRDLGEVEIPSTAENAAQQVHIYEVLGLKQTPEQARGLGELRSPMVGRQRELAMLVQLTRAVQAGLGRAVFIQGEPGLGKTRLVQEWKNAVNRSEMPKPIRWIEGRCYSYGQETPFHLVQSMLRSLIQVTDMADEPETRAGLQNLLEELGLEAHERREIYASLGHILNIRLDAESQERIRLLDPQAYQSQGQKALRVVLQRIAARQPVVVILEDLHWADSTSVEFLTPLLLLVSSEAALFCLVSRQEDDSERRSLVQAARQTLGGQLSAITLDVLSEDDSRQLVQNLLEIEALPVTVRDLILKKAEGNPFFVEEVIRMLIERQAILYQDGQWKANQEIERVEIPDNLQGLLMARIDRLPEDVKQTLRVAAVIGRQFPLRVLEAILGQDADTAQPGEPQ